MPALRPGADSGAPVRLATVVAFVLATAVFFGYLWVQAGGTVPGAGADRPYRVSFETDDLVNTVPYTDVQIAGVHVGKVDTITRVSGNRVRLDLSLDEDVAPLHEGATVQVTEKSLAGQPAVRLVDGTGPEIPGGSALPADAVVPPVTLRDVLASLDAKSLDALGGTVRSLGIATEGRTADISALLEGLADLGRDGDTAMTAIAAQSDDLERLSGELTTALEALDTGQGQIAELVSGANRLTAATAGQRQNLEATVRKLPALFAGMTRTAGDFDRVSAELDPIAADLRAAAPGLDRALVQLPATTADLRGLLPPLQAVLDKAPATLDRVPAFGEVTRDVIPAAITLLRDLNPMLRYLKPYGRDIAQMFTNFGGSFHHYGDDGGSYVFLRPVFDPLSVRPNPVELPINPLIQKNPYPGPGGFADLKPFTGDFPRVERDPE